MKTGVYIVKSIKPQQMLNQYCSLLHGAKIIKQQEHNDNNSWLM